MAGGRTVDFGWWKRRQGFGQFRLNVWLSNENIKASEFLWFVQENHKKHQQAIVREENRTQNTIHCRRRILDQDVLLGRNFR